MDYFEIKEKRNVLHDELVRAITEKLKTCKNNEYLFPPNGRPYFYYTRKTKVIKVGLCKERGVSFNDLCFYTDNGDVALACVTPIDSLLWVLAGMSYQGE